MNTQSEFPNEQRAVQRYQFADSAILYDSRFYRLPITLLDVSTRGMKIADEDLIKNHYVLVEWQDKAFEATVMWSDGYKSGIKFIQEIDVNHPILQAAKEASA